MVSAKTSIDAFILSGIQSRMKTGELVLKVEYGLLSGGITFIVVVDCQFTEGTLQISLQNRVIRVFI